MLVLSRKSGEGFWIGPNVHVFVEIRGHKARLAIEAPKEVTVLRDELLLTAPPQNLPAAEPEPSRCARCVAAKEGRAVDGHAMEGPATESDPTEGQATVGPATEGELTEKRAQEGRAQEGRTPAARAS